MAFIDASSPSSASGETFVLPDGSSRGWDGSAWTSKATGQTETIEDERLKRRRRPLRFLRHRWFWVGFLGLLAGVVIAAVASRHDPANRWLLAVAGFVGCGAMLLATSMLVWARLQLGSAPQRGRAIGVGVLGGVTAVVLAAGIEVGIKHIPLLGNKIALLALAGPIEEAAKILVPVIVLIKIGQWLRDPRAGFIAVFVSGVVFGIAEGIEYVAAPIHLPGKDEQKALSNAPESVAHVASLMERSLVEMMHPWLTASIAAVVWLTAWRTGKVWTRAAVIAFVLAAGAHAINDAVFAGLLADSHGIGLILSWIGLAVVYVWLFRRNARELTPPGALADNPRAWQPRYHGLP